MTSFFRQRATLDDASAVRLAHSLLFPDIELLFSLIIEFQYDHDAVQKGKDSQQIFGFTEILIFFIEF